MNTRRLITKAVNQVNSHAPASPAGGWKIAISDTAIGIGATYMYGCRRPSLLRVRSDREPTIGSEKPSKIRLTLRASPASVADIPSTWL